MPHAQGLAGFIELTLDDIPAIDTSPRQALKASARFLTFNPRLLNIKG
jgi:hypothetical protein